jgi:inosine/xanthosine triphosphate pyrophosphatase family protein
MSTHRGLKVSLGLAVLALTLSPMVYSAEPNSPVASPSGQSEGERLQRDLQGEKDRGVAYQCLIAMAEKRSNELQAEQNRLSAELPCARERCKDDTAK